MDISCLHDNVWPVETYLLKASLKSFVLKECHWTHQVTHKDEVPFGFQAESRHIVEVGAL